MKRRYSVVVLCIGAILAVLGGIESVGIARSHDLLLFKDVLRASFDFTAGMLLLRIVSWSAVPPA